MRIIVGEHELNIYRHAFTSCVTDSMVTGHSYSVICQYDSVNSFLEDHDVLSSMIQFL